MTGFMADFRQPTPSIERERMYPILCALFAIVLAAAAPAWAEKRVALVIGNGAYKTQPLRNPASDAELMAITLGDLGFEVVKEIDADRRGIARAVRKFGSLLQLAGQDAVGFVFYAGHGIQSRGENYMIPVDAHIEDALDVELEGFPASTLLSSLDAAGNRLNIVVMDACRNNPYEAATRAGGGGLARMDAPSGTLIAYSTAPGKVAADGRGKNSPYTQALARAIKKPGAPVEEVFKEVRIRVMDRTGSQQVPWESSSLTGSFYFVEDTPEAKTASSTANVTSTAATESSPRSASGADLTALDLAFWNSIKDSQTEADFTAYLQQFPNGTFAALARNRLESVQPAKSGEGGNVSNCSGKFTTWWEDTEIAMLLDVAPDGSVKGSYDYEQGQLQGQITDNVLIGRYLQNGNGQKGDVSFTFDEQCNWFTGTWRNTSNLFTFSGEWIGCKDPLGDCPRN